MITTATKDLIADLVHEGVCTLTESDGVGRCHWYACGVSWLASKVTGKVYVPQGGDIMIQADPDRPTMAIGFSAHKGGMDRLEFHSWAVGPVPKHLQSGGTLDKDNKSIELIDLTSRHYPAYVSDQTHLMRYESSWEDEPTLKWRRGNPPAYLWANFADIPKWVSLKTHPETTRKMFDMMREPKILALRDWLFEEWESRQPPKKTPKARAAERRKRAKINGELQRKPVRTLEGVFARSAFDEDVMHPG
jgi:hypothetical protein